MSGTNGSAGGGTTASGSFTVLCDVTEDGTATTFLRRYVAGPDGSATTDTELDGVTEYTVAGTVAVCAEEADPNPAITSTAQRQTGAGTVTIPTGARSVTLLAFTGAPTVAIGGGDAAAFPAGSSGTWAVDRGGPAGEALAEEFVFIGVAGDDFTVLTTREA